VLVLIPVILLLLSSLAITLLGLFRHQFKYHWLIAVGGALGTFIAVWVTRGRFPIVSSLGGGEVSILTLQPFSLQMDEVTWPFALALVTLCLAVLLTDVGRAAGTSWLVWAGDLGLTALGLVAVLAGNPLTLLIGWSFVDVIELMIFLREVQRAETRRRVLFFFAASVVGSMSVLGAVVAAGSLGMTLSFSTIPQQAQIFLVLAAGLRMGVFPLQVTFLQEMHHQRGQGTLLRLLPPVTSMPLLVYAAFTPIAPSWRYILLAFSLLAAIYGAVAWARARNELQGRIFWIISLAGLMFFSTLQFSPQATMVWGLAMVYGGASLFLVSVRTKWMVSLSIFSLVTITMLPLTPTAPGSGMYSPMNGFVVGLPIAQAALLFGYLRHSLKLTEPLRGVERWVQAVYPIGLVLLPLNYLLSTYLSPLLPEAAALPSWPIVVLAGALLVLAFLYFRKISLPARVLGRLDKFFSLQWFYPMLERLYQGLGWITQEISMVLGGEGGVLWALVLLVLLISIFAQVAAGLGAS
jgi:hypothetical protein